jgi:hypothetical protein
MKIPASRSDNHYTVLYQFSTGTYNTKQTSWNNSQLWQNDPLLEARESLYTATPLSAKKIFQRDTRLDPKNK